MFDAQGGIQRSTRDCARAEPDELSEPCTFEETGGKHDKGSREKGDGTFLVRGQLNRLELSCSLLRRPTMEQVRVSLLSRLILTNCLPVARMNGRLCIERSICRSCNGKKSGGR